LEPSGVRPPPKPPKPREENKEPNPTPRQPVAPIHNQRTNVTKTVEQKRPAAECIQGELVKTCKQKIKERPTTTPDDAALDNDKLPPRQTKQTNKTSTPTQKKPTQTISPQETDATSNPPSLKKVPNAPSVKKPSPFPQKEPNAPSVKNPSPFPQKASNPDDAPSVKAHSYWPDEIISIIKSILSTITPYPKPLLFKFDLSLEAAHKNYCVMRRFDKNLGKALKLQQESLLGYGSKFQKADVLEPFFHLHPKWERFKNLLINRSVWPLAEISKEERVKDVEEALTFSNHKGATKQPDLLKLLVNNNVIHGFAFPLPLNTNPRHPPCPFEYPSAEHNQRYGENCPFQIDSPMTRVTNGLTLGHQ
jgi:hypothetical protein